MIPRLLIGAILMALSGPALAQTLTVRSGEHNGFTRLVTRLPDGAEWRLEQDGPQARLFILSADAVFDTTGVFGRIRRDRLAALSQDGPGAPMELDLACNCPVTSFIDDGSYVVLDIADQVSEEPVRFGLSEPSEPVELDMAEEPQRSGPALPNVLPLLAGNAAAQLAASGQGFGSVMDAGEPGAMRAEELEEPLEDDGMNAAAALRQSERILQDQLSRAATQGLVEIDPEALRDIETQTDADDPFSDLPANVNMRATTSVDRDMVMVTTPQSVSGISGYCLPPAKVDLSAWGDDRPFGHQIGAYRTRMAGEFDDLSTSDLIGLARTYLHFGFGAEARQLLQESGTDNRDIPILIALSQLLDDGYLEEPHPLDHQVHCDSVVALWSVLANPISTRDAVNSGAILRAFVELPVHIRNHIGPSLVRRFTDAGDSETAELLLRVINRAAPHDGPPMQLAEADLARLNGEQDAADALVEDVAHSGVEESPAALVTLVDRHFDTRKPLPNDTVALLDSYLLEMRRTEIGPDMARAHALALALAGDFSAAFTAIGKLDRSQAEGAFVKALTLLTENADDLTFLELSMGSTTAGAAALPSNLTMDIARRYLDIGFPERTLAMLDRPFQGNAPEGLPALRAEAALGAGLPRRALLELVGRSGPETDALRAEALRMSGLHAEAAELYSAIEAPEDASRSEWLAGLPPAEGEQAGAFAERQAASQRLSEGNPSPADLSLATARSLLEQAETLRRDIELLNAGPGDQQQ